MISFNFQKIEFLHLHRAYLKKQKDQQHRLALIVNQKFDYLEYFLKDNKMQDFLDSLNNFKSNVLENRFNTQEMELPQESINYHQFSQRQRKKYLTTNQNYQLILNTFHIFNGLMNMINLQQVGMWAELGDVRKLKILVVFIKNQDAIKSDMEKIQLNFCSKVKADEVGKFDNGTRKRELEKDLRS